MPTVVRFGSFKISVFANDHNPPHFHILTPDHAAIVSFDTLEVIAGFVPKRDYEVALDWARNNMDVLVREWNQGNE